MPFGTRRFTQLVMHAGIDGDTGKPVAVYYARFLPTLDLNGDAEQVDEQTLVRELADNARAVRPLPDGEEQLALSAFKAQAKAQTASRARMVAAAERAAMRQTSLVDPLRPDERLKLERWRKLVTKRALQQISRTHADNDSTLAGQHDLLDASRDVLALLDAYFPPPTTTKGHDQPCHE